jgi:hypothetical protein
MHGARRWLTRWMGIWRIKRPFHQPITFLRLVLLLIKTNGEGRDIVSSLNAELSTIYNFDQDLYI